MLSDYQYCSIIDKLEEIIPPTNHNFSEELDFILSHFKEPIFPRTISTWKTGNKQTEVFDKRNSINLFDYSKLIDCKINAYPSFVEYKGINRQAPTFIFIDLDRLLFKTDRGLKLALSATLKNINLKLGAQSYRLMVWQWLSYIPANRRLCPGRNRNI